MSGVANKIMSAAGGAGAGFTAIEDVFSTYLYTGNGSTQTITNGIDLAGEGGLVWLKSRALARAHNLFDSERIGASYKFLSSDTTAAEVDPGNRVTEFNADGFTMSSSTAVNASGETYASWTFRKAPRFFDVVTYTGDGVARTVSHNLGTTVGSIIIKRTDTTSNWAVYHRGNTAAPETDYLALNKADATVDDVTYWNDTTPTDSVFTVGTNSNVNASGGTYVAYLFAHDPLGPSGDGSDGLIACGSYTGGGTGVNVNVNLGWEPQWILVKNTSAAGDWYIVDTMRGLTVSADERTLSPNLSAAEDNKGCFVPTATGFYTDSTAPVNISGNNYIYIAIRRGPMRAPESGTEVFAMDNADGTFPAFDSNFPVDLGLQKFRDLGVGTSWGDRLRGPKTLGSSNTSEEGGANEFVFDSNVGWRTATASSTLHSWMFRRAPEFFDVVAYTGTGANPQTHNHNLGVAPEMIIIKRRDASGSDWIVYHSGNDVDGDGQPWTDYLRLDSTQAGADAAYFSDYEPTSVDFRAGGFPQTGASGGTYIAYLFATLAGVSKVGSYTGNGTSQTINCGFTTGARFILIKRTDSTGDWYVWDTARGIVAANDPHLSLNTTAAEVTTDDSVDPDSSGFIVNQVAATNINVSAASYIFYAVA